MKLIKSFKTLRNLIASVNSNFTTYTPSLTWGGTAPANITIEAVFKKIGNMVHFGIKLGFDSGSTATSVYATLPLPINQAYLTAPVCMVQNASSAKYAIFRSATNDIYASTGSLASVTWISLSGFYRCT